MLIAYPVVMPSTIRWQSLTDRCGRCKPHILSSHYYYFFFAVVNWHSHCLAHCGPLFDPSNTEGCQPSIAGNFYVAVIVM